MRRYGGGEKIFGNKRIPAQVWTGYAGGLGFIRLRATNQNTLGGARGTESSRDAVHQRRSVGKYRKMHTKIDQHPVERE